tara:strand:+ start:984 stop:1160 length:177 start_codon:yes stop_codon:yes gene_type:complete
MTLKENLRKHKFFWICGLSIIIVAIALYFWAGLGPTIIIIVLLAIFIMSKGGKKWIEF